MTARARRTALYSIGTLALAALVYGGFIYEAEPDVGTLVSSAEIHAQIGCFDDAIGYAKRALAQEPDNRYAHIILAYCSHQLGDDGSSLAHYEKAISLTAPTDQSLGLLRLYRAEVLVSAGRPEEAVTVAREVLEADPEQSQALFVVAKARRSQKRYDEAIEACRGAERAHPEDPAPQIMMAEVEEERGDLDAALDHLARVAELSPGDGSVSLRRARLLVATGDREGAVREIQTARETKLALTRKALRECEEFAGLLDDPRVRAIIDEPPSSGSEPEKKR